MKYILFIPVIGAALTSLWLWQRQNHLDAEKTALRAQIVRLQSLPHAQTQGTEKTAGSAQATGSGKPAQAAAAAAAPFRSGEFRGLAEQITLLEAEPPSPDRQERMRLKVTEVFHRLQATPPEELKRILDELPHLKLSADGRSQVTSAIMGLLAQSDPPAAAAYALEENSRPGTLEAALRGWAKLDAGAAARWLESQTAAGKIPSHANAAQLQLMLLPHQLAADPAGAAVDRIAGIQPAHLPDLFKETARLLSFMDQRQAFVQKLAATPGMPPDAIRQFLHQVGRESSITDAVALLEKIGPGLEPEEFDKTAVQTATARIDSGTPAHADWLLQNLRGPDKTPAITRLMEMWTQADFNAAATWLKDQPASESHDIAVAAFAPLVAGKEPPSAVDWALTIRDPGRKSEALTGIYETWSANDPEQALTYFHSKGITPPSP